MSGALARDAVRVCHRARPVQELQLPGGIPLPDAGRVSCEPLRLRGVVDALDLTDLVCRNGRPLLQEVGVFAGALLERQQIRRDPGGVWRNGFAEFSNGAHQKRLLFSDR
jgi:hypothetical protein